MGANLPEVVSNIRKHLIPSRPLLCTVGPSVEEGGLEPTLCLPRPGRDHSFQSHLQPHTQGCPGRCLVSGGPRSLGFPGGSEGKESSCNAGDLGLIPGLRRSPGGGHGSSLQYSCLENPMDRGAWWATVHAVTRVGHDLAT